MDHWLKSLLLESSTVSAEEMLSPESVPRLPSWFVAHKMGLPRLPFLFVLNNELRLHPSLEGMESITPSKDQLNSLGAPVAVTLRLQCPAGTAESLWQACVYATLCFSKRPDDRARQHKHVCQSWPTTDRADVKHAACSRAHYSPAAQRSGTCLAACSEHIAALHLH